MAERILAVLAGLLGVAAGVLAVWGVQASAKVDDLEATADSVVDERNQLSDDLARANDEIAALEEAATSTTTAPDTTVTTAGTTGTTVEPGQAGIFRETAGSPVTFAAGDGIDLDTRDTNWDVSDIGGDVKLYEANSGLSLSIPSGVIAIADQQPTYEYCDAQTVIEDQFSPELTTVGQRFCMKTSEGRWAGVTISGLDPGRGTVTLDIVVWTLQTD